MINSRDKGARGERLASEFLRKFNFQARRGQQYRGSPDSEDIIHDVPGVFIEVKFRERLNLEEAYAQALRDSPSEKVPLVMHKKKNKQWMITLTAEDFFSRFRLGLRRSKNEM